MEDRYLETHKTWNKIAQFYEDKFMELELYNDTYKSFCDLLLRPNASVLEIGCGPGNITRHIMDFNPDLRVLATDISNNMIDLAKSNNPKVDFQILDCRKINTINLRFDGIICGFTIPYLSHLDCSKLISDCSNLLPEGGALYLSFVSGDYNKSGFIDGGSGGRVYFYYHEHERINKDLKLNQMTIVDSFQKEYKKSDTISEIHTIILAKKTSMQQAKRH
jgi:ubiquinone/menaquinone biosynthesis C-methylase UbiE